MSVAEKISPSSGAETYWFFRIPPQLTRIFVFSNFGTLIIKLLITTSESQATILCIE
jgi:hypothetical protein